MSQIPKNDSRAKIKAIELALIDDIFRVPEAELEHEFTQDGLNIKDLASSMRSGAMELIMQERKKKLAKARAGMLVQSISKSDKRRPSLDAVKRVLAELFQAKPALAVAFRQGKSQSETDWYSLWDDLVELGEISESSDEN
jgi:hypothetical protein